MMCHFEQEFHVQFFFLLSLNIPIIRKFLICEILNFKVPFFWCCCCGCFGGSLPVLLASRAPYELEGSLSSPNNGIKFSDV